MRTALLAAAAVLLLASPAAAGKLDALKRTVVVASPGPAVAVPALLTPDGEPLAAERLRGHWSLVFFGFTSCPDVCPSTLRALDEVRLPGAQIVFVTVDPQRDTPGTMKRYLAPFKQPIIGLTGPLPAITRFADALGAGFTGTNHSTSLFVLGPDLKLAGTILRPTDPVRVKADLAALMAHRGGAGAR